MPTPSEAIAAWSAVCAAPQAGLTAVEGNSDRWSRWAAGVCLMSVGRYDWAFESFTALADGVDGADEVAGLAAAAIGSGMRQLGDHRAAVEWDCRASGSPGAARVDGLIGLVADSIGQGDAAAARDALLRARGESTGWRDEVRFGWVATELALLTDDPSSAVRAAEAAAATATAAGAVRHRLKSQLFLAVARRALVPASAEADLHRIVRETGELELRPLLWPTVLVLGAQASAAERFAGRAAVEFIAAHRPTGVGSNWDAPLLLAGLQ